MGEHKRRLEARAVDTAAGWASVAISLKRIADALEKRNAI